MEEKKLLESWKEIASYLGRSEKTCRRFEQELGLPVHRLEETPKARVFAYKKEVDLWIKATQHSEKEFHSEKPFMKKFSFPATVVLGMAIIALILWQLVLPNKKNRSISTQPEKPFLTVLYFKNSTGDPSLDFWRTALAESLITDLHQSRHVKVLPQDRLYTILKNLDLLEARSYTSEELEKIASQGQSQYLLQGSFSKAGDTFRIETILQDIKAGEIMNSERVEGQGQKSFFPMIDDLTRRIKLSFSITPSIVAADIDRNIDEITTSSPEALQHYTKAMQYLGAGESHNSISSLEMAIAVDPNFAMAYRALGSAYTAYGNIEKKIEYTQKALELVDRVSVREKYNIQAVSYMRSGKRLDAIEAYEQLLELYPDDTIGNSNLPLLYLGIGKSGKAVELAEQAIPYFPNNTSLYCNLAYFYFTMGSHKKAEDVLRNFEKNISSNNNKIKMYLAMSLSLQNEYSQALKEIESSIALDPQNQISTMTKGDIHLFQGDFFQAEREYTKLSNNKAFEQIGCARLGALYLLFGQMEDSIAQVEKGLELQKIQGRNLYTPDFYLQLAYRHLRVGEHEKALKLCNEALSYAMDMENLEWQLWALYFKGLTNIGNKSIEEAQTTVEELLEIAQASFNDKDIRWHYHLLGLIDLEKEEFPRAVEHFEKALALTNYEGHWSKDLHALFIKPLAIAHYRSGDLERSRREYEKILSLTKGRLNYGDIYAESFFRLGNIAEQQGKRRRALKHYEKFFDLWKDADLEFPEAQDVKDRLDI